MLSVRARLTLWNMLLVACSLIAMGLALRVQLHATLLAQIDGDLRHDLVGVGKGNIVDDRKAMKRGVIYHAERGVTDDRFSQLPPLPLQAFGASGAEGPKASRSAVVEVVRTHSGAIRFESQALLPRLIPVPLPEDPDPLPVQPFDRFGYDAASAGRRTYHDFVLDGRRMRSLSEPIDQSGRIQAVTQAARDLAPLDVQTKQLDASLSMLLPLAVLVAAASGGILVGSTLRPLRRLTDSAKTLERDLSSKRLPVAGKDEFAELAGAFNDALDRTASAFETQRQAMQQLERFAGDAGHELRTPLGVVKGSVTYLLHGREWDSDALKSLELIDASSDRMTKLIGDLLLLARQDSGQPLCVEKRIPLAALLTDALEPLAAPGGPTVDLTVDPSLTVDGERDGLSRAFTNLLSNALRYARACVSVSAKQVGSQVVVEIEDDGEGIAPEHLARLGERFYRPDAARARQSGGTGLGIAIAKSIIESHGGAMEFQSQPGVGTRAVIRFPQI